MAELNELFEEIFHSERTYQAKTDYSKQLNCSIKETIDLLEKTRQELQTKQGELAVKNSKLINVETEVTLLQFRKSIFQAQKQEIVEATAALGDNHAIILKEVASEKESFNKIMNKFCCYYDLSGSGLRYREEQEKKELSTLQDELVLIETELLEIESYMEDEKILTKEVQQAEESLQRDRDVEEVFKAQEMEQILLIGELEKDKISKDGKHLTNSELKNLQVELDACKTCKEEEVCKRLRLDLEDLQEENYRKQMKLQVERQSRFRKTSPVQTMRNDFELQKEGSFPAADAKEEGACFFESDYESDNADEIWNTVDQMDLSMIEKEQENLSDDMEEITSNLALPVLPEKQTLKSRNAMNFIEGGLQSYQKRLPPSNFANKQGCRPSKNVQKERITSEFQSASLNNAPECTNRKKCQSGNASDERPCNKDPIKRSKLETNKSSSPNTQIKWPHVLRDSPYLSLISRKRPGESIYKAPGLHNEITITTNQPKKKVHFHY